MPERLLHYIEINGQPIPEPNILVWARWFETANRIVAQTQVGEATVSTVFLGFDYNFWTQGQPLLYETLIFGGDMDGREKRYATRAQALAGHEAVLRAFDSKEGIDI